MTLRYEAYDHDGGREWMAAFGPTDGPQVLIVPPLFEEMNFTRAVLVAMARGLAAQGIGAWLIDLPGTGESDRAIETIGLEDMRAAVTGAASAIATRADMPHIASARGGALLEDAATARSWWRFAGADGAALLRQMERAEAIGDKEAGRLPDPDAATVDLIGYRIARPFRDALRAARQVTPPGPLRERPFDGPGVAPWRRAEPTADAALSAVLADDIHMWIASCAD